MDYCTHFVKCWHPLKLIDATSWNTKAHIMLINQFLFIMVLYIYLLQSYMHMLLFIANTQTYKCMYASLRGAFKLLCTMLKFIDEINSTEALFFLHKFTTASTRLLHLLIVYSIRAAVKNTLQLQHLLLFSRSHSFMEVWAFITAHSLQLFFFFSQPMCKHI